MTDMPTTVTVQDLQAAAASRGIQISRDELKTLRHEGLMPDAFQKHVVGKRGSETHYPEWALRQLTDLIDLRSRRRQRPYTIVRFIAWEEGLWVEHKILRTTIAELVRHSVAPLQRTGHRTDDVIAQRVATDKRRQHRHPLASILLGARASEGSVRDLAFNVGQIATKSEDADRAKERLNEVTSKVVPEDVEVPGGLMSIFDSFDLPSVGQWPRIVSRANTLQIEVGRTFLPVVREASEASPVLNLIRGDSIGKIRLRAIVASGMIVAIRTNPEAAERFVREEESDAGKEEDI